MAEKIVMTPEQYRRVMGQLSFFWGPRGRTNVLWADYITAILGA